MNPENTFIAPSVISLRDGLKSLMTRLEARPKPPPQPSGEQLLLLRHFHELQVRMGGAMEVFEMEIDELLKTL